MESNRQLFVVLWLRQVQLQEDGIQWQVDSEFEYERNNPPNKELVLASFGKLQFRHPQNSLHELFHLSPNALFRDECQFRSRGTVQEL